MSELDRQGYTVLEAIAHEGRESQSHSRPNTFLCIDGFTYWVKGQVQQGLVAELIAGRLARRIGAGPRVRIVRVPAEALPASGRAQHLEGLVVGSEDVSDTVNARELHALIPSGRFEPARIDAAARARVIVFQSWLGVQDTQVLVRLTDGAVFSIDHGDAFGNAGDRADPSILVVPIPGVDHNVGKRRNLITPVVAAIQDTSDEQLLYEVARVPGGGPWQSPAARRLSIAEYLAHRRDRLQEVMDRWLSS